MDSASELELRDVLSYYDLGELVDYERNERGFVNTAYAICTLKGGDRKWYFLRKYRPGIQAEELIFEHSIIEHLVAKGAPVAGIHHTKSGDSFLRRPRADQAEPAFYTIFDYLPGEDLFTWVDPILTPAQLSASANVLARFHMDAAGFSPLGRRTEPRILDLLPVIADTWSGCPARSKGTVFDDRVRECLEPIQSEISLTLATLQEPEALALPQTVIHCDYHPGNLKFSGDAVTGLFDFDWSKVDLRLFDLGLALWYFCTCWRGPEDGGLRLDWAHTFLCSYQDVLLSRSGVLPLTPDEVRYLPAMICAGNLYILHWTVLDYFAKDVDTAEYLGFLDHSLRFTVWYKQPGNRAAVQSMIAAAMAHTA